MTELQASYQAPTAVVTDDELSVRVLNGTGSRMVLVFTGVRHKLGDIPLDEFIGSASEGSKNHVLFISDLKRSWYSRPGLVARIRDTVMRQLDALQVTELCAVGNSMGGYGAMLLSGHLPIKTVAAFSPQVSMHPEVIDERRWSKHRRNFGSELLRSVGDVLPNSEALIAASFGATSTEDMQQAALLPELDNLRIFEVAGLDHTLSASLKAEGLGAEVLQAKLDGDWARVAELYASFEARAANKPTPPSADHGTSELSKAPALNDQASRLEKEKLE